MANLIRCPCHKVIKKITMRLISSFICPWFEMLTWRDYIKLHVGMIKVKFGVIPNQTTKTKYLLALLGLLVTIAVLDFYVLYVYYLSLHNVRCYLLARRRLIASAATPSWPKLITSRAINWLSIFIYSIKMSQL